MKSNFMQVMQTQKSVKCQSACGAFFLYLYLQQVPQYTTAFSPFTFTELNIANH